jgi:hypothetical protein
MSQRISFLFFFDKIFWVDIFELLLLSFGQLTNSMFENYFRVLQLKVHFIDYLEIFFKSLHFLTVILKLHLDFIDLVLKRFGSTFFIP